MKKMLKVLVVGATICASMAVGAIAASKQEEIKAYMDYGITIKLDGQVKTLTNGNGERQYPIRYKGTTYVPLRAVSQLVGLPVNWDGATETVLLGDNNPNLKLNLVEYAASKATGANWIINSQDELKIKGESANETYNSGIACTLYGWIYDKDRMTFSTCAKDTLTFTVWTDGTKPVTVCVYDQNNNVIDKFALKSNEITERTISIKGIEKISFGRECDYFTNGTLKILDPVIYNK